MSHFQLLWSCDELFIWGENLCFCICIYFSVGAVIELFRIKLFMTYWSLYLIFMWTLLIIIACTWKWVMVNNFSFVVEVVDSFELFVAGRVVVVTVKVCCWWQDDCGRPVSFVELFKVISASSATCAVTNLFFWITNSELAGQNCLHAWLVLCPASTQQRPSRPYIYLYSTI